MFGWKVQHGSSSSVSVCDLEDEHGAHGEGEGGCGYNAGESKETHTPSQRNVADGNKTRRVAPSIEDLDPAVTAAILTQVRCDAVPIRRRTVLSLLVL